MGVRLISNEGKDAQFNSSTGWAFGPVFETTEEGEAFLAYLTTAGVYDPRDLSDAQLGVHYGAFRAEYADPETGEPR